MSSVTGILCEENVDKLPPSTLQCTSNISTQKEIVSSKAKSNDYLKQRGRRRKWWYFNRSLQPISEACENKDDPCLTECNNAINDNNTFKDDHLNIKNQSLNCERSEIIVSGNDQPVIKDSYSPCLKVIEKFQEIVMDSAVRVIQAAFKRFRERRRFLRIKRAVMVIQRNLRKWIQARQCLRPADFERQSSDGAKSDEYRESEEENKEKILNTDNDSSDFEKSHLENANAEEDKNSQENSITNSHESTQNELDHNIHNPTQETIENTTEKSSEHSEITQSCTDPANVDGTNNQDVTELHSNANTIQQVLDPGLSDYEQNKIVHETTATAQTSTITYSCAVCGGMKERIEVGTINESNGACGHNKNTIYNIQLLQEGVASDNVATIVLELTTGHQQERSQSISHDDEKTHEKLNKDDEQALQHEQQCELVTPHGQNDQNTQNCEIIEEVDLIEGNEIEEEYNIVGSDTNKTQVGDNNYVEDIMLEGNGVDEECGTSQDNNEVQQCGTNIVTTSEVQENAIDKQVVDSDEKDENEQEPIKTDKEIESFHVLESEDENSNALEHIGTTTQHDAGDEESLKHSPSNFENNTDNDINLNNIKV